MKTVAQNRRARYDYQISDTFEAGIALSGQEVKSARQGNINLTGSYISFLKGVPVLKNATIAKYAYASNLDDYDPSRDRQLLLKKSEIAKIEKAAGEKGVTIVPLSVLSGRHIKVTLGIGRGQKKYDKREKIKGREVERRVRRGEEY